MEGLGIDFKLLIIQVVNFLILLLILKKWIYKPFLKFLDDRAAKIHESLKASQTMREELRDFEVKKEKELESLKEKSQTILENVRREALEEKKNTIEMTTNEAKSIMEAARNQIEADRKKALKDIQKEVSFLALEISKKIFSGIDVEKARPLIDNSLQEDPKNNLKEI